MDAKKEAEELLQFFYDNQCSYSITELAYSSAKQCALVSIENTITALRHHQWQNRNIIEHYIELNEEINKL